MPITVLFAEDSVGHTALLNHSSATGGAPGEAPVEAWDDLEPQVQTATGLLDVLANAQAVGDPLPDVVLVDDWMSWDGKEKARPNAVRLAGEVTRRLGARRPKLVLWTSLQDDPWLRRFAFLSYGGHGAAAKNKPGDPDAAALDVIRRVAAGQHDRYSCDVEQPARPSWPSLGAPGDREVIAQNLHYLATLHATRRTEDAAALLTDSGFGAGELYTADRVGRQRQRVGAKLGRETGERWSIERVCQEALDAGWLWVPPSEWQYCPFASWRCLGAMAVPHTE